MKSSRGVRMLQRGMDRTTGARGAAAPTAVRSAEELAAVLRALPDLYFLLDGERRFVDYSAGHMAELYRAPEEFLGQPFDAVLPPDISAGMIVAMDRARETNDVTTYDYALELPSGQQWYECRFAPFGDSFTVALVRNVTERRLAAEELRLREERLRQAEKLEVDGRMRERLDDFRSRERPAHPPKMRDHLTKLGSRQLAMMLVGAAPGRHAKDAAGRTGRAARLSHLFNPRSAASAIPKAR